MNTKARSRKIRPPQVLTAPQVAEQSGYDISTVCRWARSGALPGTKLPGPTGTWIFDPKVLDLIRHK